MAYLFKKKFFFRTDGQTDEWTQDKRTHGRTDGRTVRLYYAPNFIWGHKNVAKRFSPIIINQTLFHNLVRLNKTKTIEFMNQTYFLAFI